MELRERDQKVLEAVISGYIRSGEPVGSRTVSKHYGLNVSSATIRNIMADLEDMGLLQQPHTSAGRIPTDKGLRLYLDSILKIRELEKQQQVLIRKAFESNKNDLEELLRRTSQVLSQFCKQAGVVLWPRLTATRFKHIEFVRLRPRQILVVLISKSGLVQHTILDWEEDITQDDLDKYARYLNELLEDAPLAEVKDRILREMESEKVLFDQLFSQALALSERAFQEALDSAEVHIEGQMQLLRNPEFADVERMRRILEAFEDKTRIIRLLDKALDPQRQVQIVLGTESDVNELQELSLVSSPYKRGETVLGVLGVIGPMRMDYSRIIPIVTFTAALLSQLLADPKEDMAGQGHPEPR
ncbi:heat-inducible transcription repressor HrcA [Desulfacinum hydrothermale DSM 13146]|uniref:Heat-inducible transcription repressor HrcA n=1 Tax=Desulfacinum hydrothermale DSM 13146 TaxID=1121390 RepID=A0A1W1XBE7_9BACT|nr:heat-inducible transcriptional repressor HrcA [Desulfacinum hydrothermale]SMC21179.1 heat-inducible transcription repressor HrcA [Desulfacinum hydrothermale DSM 13146]